MRWVLSLRNISRYGIKPSHTDYILSYCKAYDTIIIVNVNFAVRYILPTITKGFG